MVLIQDEEYVDVSLTQTDETTANGTSDIGNNDQLENFYEKWVHQASAKHVNPELTASDVLHKLYPGHSLVISDDTRINPLALPGVQVETISSNVVTNTRFASIPRRVGGDVPGALVESIIFGAFKLTWKTHDFIVHVMKVPVGQMGLRTVYFILRAGTEELARQLLLSAGLFQDQLHDEIWVYNQGFWDKDKGLWIEIQNSSWDDVVMKDVAKAALQNDIYGFFKSEMVYKKLALPWKRGLIMYGPPGNGKTISIKVVMKTCAERGFTPLYVKSFQSYRGEEASMQDVFQKARQASPCVLILEDLDSLINDQNRSFFLNQLDGLEGNDGLLVIGSTNHFDMLDPALSSRPSRFDRKYLFDDPDQEERSLYAKYWQNKLKDNHEITFPDSLVDQVADMTEGFSFAYLKEAFVSTLVLMTTATENEKDFAVLLVDQIATLRKEMGKQTPARKQVSLLVTSSKDKHASVPRGGMMAGSHSLPISSKLPVDPFEDIFQAKYDVSRHPPSSRNDSRGNEGVKPWFFDMARNDTSGGDQNVSHTLARTSRTEPAPFSGRRQGTPCILPAPSSAYPQIGMPGALPAQDRASIAWSNPSVAHESLSGFWNF
ncbi:P-loop containing nucleoside triphosphate hydrolase protein [Phlebopus sp. FC_14]|nr:P-loop containing nucleoside triphosphate hydrolase protein [Phlebopus sp. FC_14]